MTHYETLRRDGDAAYKAVMDALNVRRTTW